MVFDIIIQLKFKLDSKLSFMEQNTMPKIWLHWANKKVKFRIRVPIPYSNFLESFPIWTEIGKPDSYPKFLESSIVHWLSNLLISNPILGGSACLVLWSPCTPGPVLRLQTFRESFPCKFSNFSGKPERAFQKKWKAESCSFPELG